MIGNLRVNLGIDTATFAAGAKQAQTTLAGLQRSIQGFGVGVAGILGGLGLNALGSSVVQAMRNVAQIGDLAETIGVTAEQIQVFNRMALASGASTEAMAKGLQEIAEQSTDANSKLSQLFAANGITAQGRETNAVIRDFMTLLQNARTPTEQLAMATSVLGTRVGRELVEALRTGAAGYDEAMQEMVASGNYHTDAEVARLQKIEEEYNRVAANIATGWQSMVVGLVSSLDTLVNSWDSSKPSAASEFMNFITGKPVNWNIGNSPTVNMGPVGGPGQFAPSKPSNLPDEDSIKKTEDALKRLQAAADQWKSAVMTPLEQYQAQLSELKKLLDAGLISQEEYFRGVQKAQEDYGADAKKLGDTIRQSVQTPLETYKVRLTELDNALSIGAINQQTYARAVEEAGWALVSASEPIKSMLSAQMEAAKNAMEDLSDTISGDLSFALTDIAFTAKSAGDAMEMLESTALNALQNITNSLLNSGLNMLLSGMGGGGGFLSSLLGSFGGFYAKGGALGAGKWGIAGEAGPEIIHGPARVTPMDGRRGGVTVNNKVVNNSQAQVQTRATENRDGSIDIETLIEDKIVSTLGGSRAKSVMGARYGARVAPKRA